jgi:tRNA(Ile)-lysidine synthase
VDLLQKLAAWFERHPIGSEPMTVAVSGGPDSVAMLRAIVSVRPGQTLVVAHLNHQLRGDESDADEAFVRKLQEQISADLRPPAMLRVKRCNVAELAGEAGTNLEATARRLRYDWLSEVAVETSSRWIATGHTADDQAETVLHHLLRGTGLRGLRGIAAMRELGPGASVIRPLLDVSRAEVERFLAGIGQQSREDCSNQDLRYTRNRIRHSLLPLLEEQYNPAIRTILGRLAEQASNVFADLESKASALLHSAELPPAGRLRILDRRNLVSAPSLVVREALHLLWEREGWPLAEMDFDHWRTLEKVCRGQLTAADFPDGIQARYRENVVQIGPKH